MKLKLFRNEYGASITEYVILLMLLSILALFSIKMLGGSVTKQTRETNFIASNVAGGNLILCAGGTICP